MKEGLIRLTDEKDIFYDSIEKVYRYRMHCPNCKKVSEICRCYQDLDILLSDIDDGLADYTCSSKCALLVGEWDELGEAMQEADLTADLRKCVSKLNDTQLDEILKGYEVLGVLKALYDAKSSIPFSHLNPEIISHEEKLDIIFAMGDVKDVLYAHDISYYPGIEELTEEQAQKVLNVLTEDEDFDYPSGDDCEL